MAIHFGSAKIGQLRIGAQNFKEAWVGSSKVYSSAPPVQPLDGVLFSNAGVKYTTESPWTWSTSSGGYWQNYNTQRGQKVIANNVVFSPNSTRVTFYGARVTTTGSVQYHLYIDGVDCGGKSWPGSASTISYDIPARFIDGQAHNITLELGTYINWIFTSCAFNI